MGIPQGTAQAADRTTARSAMAVTAFLTAFGVVFLAELADKTQFAILALSARGHPWRVLAGAAAAFLVLSLVAAYLGAVLASLVPTWLVALVGGLLFIALGAWTLWSREEEDETPDRRGTGVLAGFTLVTLMEMGDKTQFATALLAAQSGTPLWTGLGAATAMSTSGLLAVLAGAWLKRHVSEERMETVSGVLFIVLGVLFMLSGWLPVWP